MPTPITLPGSRSVSIKVPMAALYDIKSIFRVTESLLGQLGCPACHSGFDIRFDAIEKFVVDRELNVLPDMDGSFYR